MLPGLQRATDDSLPPAETLLRMVVGKKSGMSSRFQLDAPFVLAAIASEHQALSALLRASLMARETDEHARQLQAEAAAAREEPARLAAACDAFAACTADDARAALFREYCHLYGAEQQAKQAKQRRRLARQRHDVVSRAGAGDAALWERAHATHLSREAARASAEQLEGEHWSLHTSAVRATLDMLGFLAERGYVRRDAVDTIPCDDVDDTFAHLDALDTRCLTVKGRCCTLLRECPAALVVESVLGRDAYGERLARRLEALSAEQIATVLACTIDERFECAAPLDAVRANGVLDDAVLEAIELLRELNHAQQKLHDDAYVPYSGCVNPILGEYAALWCAGRGVAEVLSAVCEHMDLGNFVRAMLSLQSRLEELRAVYALLDHPNEKKLCDLLARNAIVRDAVRVDSMYFR